MVASVAQHVGSQCVLVVDEDPGVCRLWEEVLGGNGLRVVTATTGGAAIAFLRQQPVGVFVVDLALPDMEGVALIEQAFAMDRRMVGAAVIAHNDVEAAVSAMKAGASEVLAKPVQPDLALSTVHRLLELYRLRQEQSVLKGAVVKSGAVELRSPQLADFGQKERVGSPDGLTEFERGVMEGERRERERQATARAYEHRLLTDVGRRLEQAIVGLHATIEEEVCALAFAIAVKVVRQAAEANRHLILEQAQAALSRIKDAPTVQIRVHPQDVPILVGAREALAAACEGAVNFVVVDDGSVAPGGCVVETPTRLVDATLESQLSRLGTALKRPRA